MFEFNGGLSTQSVYEVKRIDCPLFQASTFKTAHDFVSTLEQKIILIDGELLTDLMFEFNVGLSTQSVYEVKKIDFDYFEE